ncbi:host-nuclease inhibitor Gam family protein [Cohnella silvisoli]|uniref:Host-nuclease inhibitor Gam family protein n=1 Tax=Cohnella silvisoli TaxID=2873699 RepID=A0ABV1L232_9BACL|nr:host-nuclease inhibitor Gam family protein [Cohnella silvisoli]MCD9025769.1 host-nuclease inhibitor Gam family protein [Cohnella silvisoli]
MAKKKIETPVLTDWEQVNEALRDLIEIDQQVYLAEATMNNQINQLKQAAELKVKPLLARKEKLEKNILIFTASRADEFKVLKTKNLTFGEVGFRKSTSIIVRNVKAIIEALKQNRMTDCIKVTETLNKEELEKYDDVALQKIGAKRKTDDRPFFKPSIERIEA